jgi:hypothetical protein
MNPQYGNWTWFCDDRGAERRVSPFRCDIYPGALCAIPKTNPNMSVTAAQGQDKRVCRELRGFRVDEIAQTGMRAFLTGHRYDERLVRETLITPLSPVGRT